MKLIKILAILTSGKRSQNIIKMEKLVIFDNGDQIIRNKRAIIAELSGPRGVMSTSPFNGGYREDLKTIFNFDCVHYCDDPCAMYAPDYAGHMREVARRLGLDPGVSAGLSTAVDMQNAAIRTASYQDISVTAVVTAGIDVNGGRAGDPAQLNEVDGAYIMIAGTINIFVFINACLSQGAMARAVMTATEAKTAALQELVVPSNYSEGLATGSGTDGIAVVCDLESSKYLTEAGKHYKLGELIGITVKEAVRIGMERHSHINGSHQSDVFQRIGRYGVTEERVYAVCSDRISRDSFNVRINVLRKDPLLVQQTALYVHLLDEYTWGMFQEIAAAANALLDWMQMEPLKQGINIKQAMISAYVEGLAKRIMRI